MRGEAGSPERRAYSAPRIAKECHQQPCQLLSHRTLQLGVPEMQLVHHPIALRAHTSFHGTALGIFIEIGRHSPCAALHVNEALSGRCARG
jgi:hypothetical protein